MARFPKAGGTEYCQKAVQSLMEAANEWSSYVYADRDYMESAAIASGVEAFRQVGQFLGIDPILTEKFLKENMVEESTEVALGFRFTDEDP